VRLDLTLPADSLLPGVVPAQDAKCSAEGNRLMSAPVSATMTSAVFPPMPGMVQIKSRKRRKGSITTSIRAVSSSMAAVCWSIRFKCVLVRNA